MHIHPGSPNSSQSEESAATKIQAGFRGYRVRKQLKQNSVSPSSNQNHNNRSIGRNQIDQIMDSNRNSNDSSSSSSSSRLNGIHTLSSSATPTTTITSTKNNNPINGSVEEKSAAKIQAGIRGYLVRKHQKLEQEAATKIQASFRGFKVRKDLQKIKQK